MNKGSIATTLAFSLGLSYLYPNIKENVIADQKETIQTQVGTIETLVGIVQTQSETIQTQVGTIEYYKKQIKGILEDAETMYKELKEKDNLIKFLEEEVSILNQELDAMEEKGEDLQREKQNLFEIWAYLREEVSNLKTDLKDLFRQNEEKDNEITILKGIQEAIDKDRFDLEVREKHLVSIIDTLREWHNLLRYANQQNASVIGSLARQVTKLKSKVSEYEKSSLLLTWPKIEIT